MNLNGELLMISGTPTDGMGDEKSVTTVGLAARVKALQVKLRLLDEVGPTLPKNVSAKMMDIEKSAMSDISGRSRQFKSTMSNIVRLVPGLLVGDKNVIAGLIPIAEKEWQELHDAIVLHARAGHVSSEKIGRLDTEKSLVARVLEYKWWILGGIAALITVPKLVRR